MKKKIHMAYNVDHGLINCYGSVEVSSNGFNEFEDYLNHALGILDKLNDMFGEGTHQLVIE